MKFSSSIPTFINLFWMMNYVFGCPYVSSTTNGKETHNSESMLRSLQGGDGFEFECRFTGGTADEAATAAKQDIINMIERRERLGPKFVRLAFHDCVNGCDGSVDTANPDNFGLEVPIARLRPIVTCYDSALTRGDIWALAGLASAEHMQDDDDDDTISFNLEYYGRVSLPDDESGKLGDVMPGNHLTTQGLLDYFNKTFGFTTQETVAIMGVHTLGFLDDDNSGFEGRWVRNPTRTDNDFYDQLTTQDGEPNPSFVQQLEENGQYLWRRTGGGGNGGGNGDSSSEEEDTSEEDNGNRRLQNRPPPSRGDGGPPPNGFGNGRPQGNPNGGGGGGGGRGRGGPIVMLNADMALISDMEGYIDSTTGFASCIPNDDSQGDTDLPVCPEASTRGLVMEFANNNGLWLTAFRNALTKITNTVPGGVESLSTFDTNSQERSVLQFQSGIPLDGETSSSNCGAYGKWSYILVVGSLFVSEVLF